MNRMQELDRADRELKEVSAQIDSIKFHLTTLEENIALLNSVKIQFDQNISTLKSDKIIASFSEYKKIKEDLTSVVNRLYMLRVDFNNHQVALERAEKILLECKAKYVTLLNNQDAKILKGKFGGKKRNAKEDYRG